jgi:pimeloyl-ACP methyl ester carboxylesterase
MSEPVQHQVTVRSVSYGVTEAGEPGDPAVVFLHGWPQSSRAWDAVMPLAVADGIHAVAVDLPGIGGSANAATDGTKAELARAVHDLVFALQLEDVVLVGHDIGGMVAYSYLRAYADLRAAVIMNVAVPGVEPWPRVLANPHIWHFGFHQVPDLPEKLIAGNERTYLDYFYDTLAARPEAITDEDRAAYAETYANPAASTAGLDWYRAFPADAEHHEAQAGPIETPLLYLRGEEEPGSLETFADGFRRAGVSDLGAALIPGAGHFAPEEAPAQTWAPIAALRKAVSR